MTSTHHPYALVKEHGDVVYVSGAASIDYETHTPVPGRREALDAALAAVESRLRIVGLGLDSVVKMTYFLTDLTLRNEANDQFEDRFPTDPPARTVVHSSELPYGAVAVIEAIAHR